MGDSGGLRNPRIAGRVGNGARNGERKEKDPC